LNKGCHLYSAGRPSRWALAHILVDNKEPCMTSQHFSLLHHPYVTYRHASLNTLPPFECHVWGRILCQRRRNFAASLQKIPGEPRPIIGPKCN